MTRLLPPGSRRRWLWKSSFSQSMKRVGQACFALAVSRVASVYKFRFSFVVPDNKARLDLHKDATQDAPGVTQYPLISVQAQDASSVTQSSVSGAGLPGIDLDLKRGRHLARPRSQLPLASGPLIPTSAPVDSGPRFVTPKTFSCLYVWQMYKDLDFGHATYPGQGRFGMPLNRACTGRRMDLIHTASPKNWVPERVEGRCVAESKQCPLAGALDSTHRRRPWIHTRTGSGTKHLTPPV